VLESSALNIYCDESCHLEHDGHELMVLGAVTAPSHRVKELARTMRDLKELHGLPRSFEAKWTKVSPGKIEFYIAVIDAFFAEPDVRFRGLVAHQKSELRHAAFGQDHDTWYHKMYYELLQFSVRPPNRHRIYVDIKDTRGGAKAAMLREVLARTYRDWDHQVVERIQIVRSHEVELLQLADLLIGATSYRSRELTTSTAKTAIVQRIEHQSQVRLDRTTPLARSKLNVFHWNPQRGIR